MRYYKTITHKFNPTPVECGHCKAQLKSPTAYEWVWCECEKTGISQGNAFTKYYGKITLIKETEHETS